MDSKTIMTVILVIFIVGASIFMSLRKKDKNNKK
jgi:hypothetical protein